jgi:hypothetical protein
MTRTDEEHPDTKTGTEPSGPFTCMYCCQGTDSDDDICDECREYVTPTAPPQISTEADTPS